MINDSSTAITDSSLSYVVSGPQHICYSERMALLGRSVVCVQIHVHLDAIAECELSGQTYQEDEMEVLNKNCSICFKLA
jgi:oligoribonuclease (3'-5' exoribonuclease)